MYKVLLVDDEYLVRQALQIILSEWADFQVIGEAKNGQEALQLYEELAPDLIFMDIMMHGINGMEVSEIIKNKNAATTIVILTAYNDFEFTKKAMQLDIHHYLLKPFSLQEIYNIMSWYTETHLKKSSRLDHFISECIDQGFEKSCTQIYEIISEIYLTKNLDQRYSMLKKLMLDLINLISGINHGYQKHFEEKFFPSEKLCKDSHLAEFWLFNLIDEIFKQKSIQAYPQFITVISYIEDNINNSNLSLYSTSAQANLSMSYLSKLFKKEFGTNFNNYINLKKIEKSKKFLKYHDISINDIAFDLGYNEPNYFCKVFKKFEGLTPTQYRLMTDKTK